MNTLRFYILFEQEVFTQPFFSSHVVKAKEFRKEFKAKRLASQR